MSVVTAAIPVSFTAEKRVYSSNVVVADEEVRKKKKRVSSASSAIGAAIELPFIPMEDMEFLDVCTNTVCGNKVICFIVRHLGKEFVLKEGRASMGLNADYCMVDACKEVFGLNKIGMCRIRSNKSLTRLDKEKKEWRGNLLWVDRPEGVVYSMMERIRGEKLIEYRRSQTSLGKPVSDDIWLEYVKIGLFRGVFMVSDFNQLNVFIDTSGEKVRLISIDEHDVLGKRVRMFGEKNMDVAEKYWSEVPRIVAELQENSEEKKAVIRREMEKYGFEESAILQACENLDLLWERICEEKAEVEELKKAKKAAAASKKEAKLAAKKSAESAVVVSEEEE